MSPRDENLDDLDLKILEVLKDDARAGYTVIGEKVGISRVSVKNRIESLEKRGVIKGYHADIDETAVSGRGTHFFVDIEVDPCCAKDIEARLASDRRIRKLYCVSGSSRIFAEGFASNNEDAGYFLRTVVNRTRGILSSSLTIVASVLKDVDGGIEYEVRSKNSEYLEGRQQVAEASDGASCEDNRGNA